MPEVTFVIPCYNYWNYIPECIASVQAQTVKDYEVIIVDDASTETMLWPLDYDHLITLIVHGKNQGSAAARNTGIEAAQGKWIVPLDADDTIEPTFLEDLLNEAYSRTFHTKVIIPNAPPLEWPAIAANSYLCYCALYDAELLKQYKYVAPFPEYPSWFDDWYLWLRLGKDGVQTASVMKHLFNWRRHPDSVWSKIEGTNLYWELREKLWKMVGYSS